MPNDTGVLPPFGGDATMPGNLGYLTPAQLLAYVKQNQRALAPNPEGSRSALGAVGEGLKGLAEGLQDRQLMQALGGTQQASPDTTPTLPGGDTSSTPSSFSGAIPDGFKSSYHAPVQAPDDTTDPAMFAAMAMSATGETGGKGGPASLANISPDSAGSKSYGSWGLNSKTGSAAQFAKDNPDLGLTAKPGTPEFDQQWQSAVQSNPDRMRQAHVDWFQSRIWNGIPEELKRAGFDSEIADSPKVRTYMADRKLQMGDVGLKRSLAEVQGAKTPEEFVNKISKVDYANIKNDFRTYLSDYPNNTKGLANRIGLRHVGALNLNPQQTDPSAVSATGASPPRVAQAGPGVSDAAPGPSPSSGSRIAAEPAFTAEYQNLQNQRRTLGLIPPMDPKYPRAQAQIADIDKRLHDMEAPGEVIDPQGNRLVGSRVTGYGAGNLPKELTAGEKEAQTAESKTAQLAVAGGRAKGLVGAQVAPMIRDLNTIVNDPGYTQGYLSGEARLKGERLARSLGLPSNAAPMEIEKQLRNSILSTMQSAGKVQSEELGQNAKLFLSEIETFKGEMPEFNSTLEGRRRGYAGMLRRAEHWNEGANKIEDWLVKQPNQIPNAGIHRLMREHEGGFHMFEPGVEKGTSQNIPSRPKESELVPAVGSTSGPSGSFADRFALPATQFPPGSPFAKAMDTANVLTGRPLAPRMPAPQLASPEGSVIGPSGARPYMNAEGKLVMPNDAVSNIGADQADELALLLGGGLGAKGILGALAKHPGKAALAAGAAGATHGSWGDWLKGGISFKMIDELAKALGLNGGH